MTAVVAAARVGWLPSAAFGLAIVVLGAVAVRLLLAGAREPPRR